MIYQFIYKTGEYCLIMRYIIIKQVKNKIYTYKIKHDFAKKCLRHNFPFLLNDILDTVKEKLSTHTSQGFVS